MWFYIANMTSSGSEFPLMCSETELICLTVDSNGNAHAKHGEFALQLNASITELGWTQIIYRYNAEGRFVNLTD